jgi:hypothetical protein
LGSYPRWCSPYTSSSALFSSSSCTYLGRGGVAGELRYAGHVPGAGRACALLNALEFISARTGEA